jgi:signal transduction histidine kinase
MRRWHRPRTLFGQVYFHGVLLLVLLLLALGAAGVLLGRAGVFAAHPARLAAHVSSVLAPLPDEALAAPLARLAEDLEVDVAVFHTHGGTVASAGGPLRPLPPSEAAHVGRAHPHAWSRAGGAVAPAGAGRYLRVRPRVSGGVLLLRALGFLSLVVLVLAAASAPVARAISRPLERLTQAARRLGRGDLAARAGLDRADEIGVLGRTFDEMAERLSRLLSAQRELLANVSHELRTPLARIRVSLDLLAEAGPGEAERHRREIEADVAELSRLVGDVLTASRLDSGGRLVLRPEDVDLAALLEGALARFRRVHAGRAVAARVPPGPSIQGEPALLDRVLENLLDNAARYSEPGTLIGLELRAADGGGAVIEIRDHGIGLSAHDLERAFTPFFRSDRSRARNTGGVGLGLALSRRIVEAHGGTISLESRPGEGTTVRVVLPGPQE